MSKNPLENINPLGNQLSAERQRELDEAKKALKDLVSTIPPEELSAMSDTETSRFITFSNGDVEEFVRSQMRGNAGNSLDMAAFHTTEKLIRLRQHLEKKKVAITPPR